MSTSRIIEEVATLLETRGHYQGPAQCVPYSGPLCVLNALGAIRKALGGRYEFSPSAAELAIGRGIGSSWERIPDWSDTTDTPTVISTLRAIAAIERAREARLLPVVRARERVTA